MENALFIKALGGMFAIMNPFVALPLFLAATDGYSEARQRNTGLRVAGYAAGMCAIIAISGAAVLKFFGISVDDFRVAGGLVLMAIAMGMLGGGGNPGHEKPAAETAESDAQGDISFYPMAFPMIVGPGTITAIIVFMGEAKNAAGVISVAVAIGIVLAALTVVLWFSSNIGRHMSQTLRVIMTRLMGMVLAAIAVSMIAAGAKALLPGLAG
ncbi:MarC family protein [Paracoccus sp. (in: a-proteobacteria)]|uniref:MarC family protein n=1 Tax=Paracoccus sp. TaxID=267 RepID=UPI003A8C034A